jgi:transitional endoplasmic reticulum ATPase
MVPLSRGLSALRLRGILWIAVAGVIFVSYLLYTPEPPAHGMEPGIADWLFRSWPALFASALGVWLLLVGPIANAPSWAQKGARLAMVFLIYSGFLFLLRWNPFWSGMNSLGFTSRNTDMGVLILVATIIWILATVRVFFGWLRLPAFGFGFGSRAISESTTPAIKVTRPDVKFRDVGGMEEAKEQIRQIVENRLRPAKFEKYGVVRNGILLHGPRGSGKTFLAEATAGEFGLSYHYLSSPALLGRWIGTTGENIRSAFSSAAKGKPSLLFIDEIDALGAPRDSGVSPGTGHREYNSITIQLMQSLDSSRSMPGLILMAATNSLEGLDPALIRDGRFDAQIRIDMPDEATRKRIFEAQLATKPRRSFSLDEFARRTPGASAARIKSLVDRAASFAAEQNRKLEERDLRRALDDTGGKDRPLFQPVEWPDLVVEPDVERDLKNLVKHLNATWSTVKGMTVPTGVLLIGPPGTGKSMIGRLLATQTRRSFYPLSAADILGGQVGASVKKLSEVFARARENSPSIVFFDEIDGLLPRNNGMLNTHDTQLVEQCRTEISQLLPEHDVLLVGTTNHVDRIDPAILRGGRFSEKIEIGTPGQANRERLLHRYLQELKLDLSVERVAEHVAGLSPADIEAICKAAVRNAFGRADREDYIPPLIWEDFERAIQRVQVQFG